MIKVRNVYVFLFDHRSLICQNYYEYVSPYNFINHSYHCSLFTLSNQILAFVKIIPADS